SSLADPDPAVRRAAAESLGTIASDPERSVPALVAALADPDADVRRLAVEGLPAASAETLRERLPLVVGDPEPRVRIAALRVWDRTLKPSRGCEPLLFAVRDGDPLVVLTALDLLARPCPEAARQRTTLLAIVGELGRSASWHAPARALAALAGSAPDALAGVIGPFERHDVPYVRAWAARAADRAGLEPPLTRLAGDPDPNVRTAALEGLFRIRQHGADDALLAALSSDDPQLVLTAARLLEGTPRGADVVPPLLETLDRLGARRQATLRDPRVALIARVAELGAPADAERLRPALQDPDPAVAGAVAAALSRLEGDSVSAPEPPTPVGRVPTEAEIERLERTRVLLDLESGGRVGIRLLPDLAPTNVARFVALARAGTLNGLGFHRVEPNFVVQGLSPGANEYAGHGDFTRDEVGRVSHWRGTVGISTRGHDTGDGQIFVNLVDNTRLDHSYTIIGEVELGMDVVDRIREGDRVRAATLVEGSGGA
ncbi:MAG: HEAT repeat domain-containing protein, partial [Gemmatimonadetes bacterium]|nr:HEAT repeat domain-containing protein [Gemmatimonadota bacterium]